MLHRARHTFIVREIGFMAAPLCYCGTQKVLEAFTVHHFLGLWVIQIQNPQMYINSGNRKYSLKGSGWLIIPKDKGKTLFCIVVFVEFGNKSCEQRRRGNGNGRSKKLVLPQRKFRN